MKRNILKRGLSAALSAAVMITSIPMGAWAADPPVEVIAVENVSEEGVTDDFSDPNYRDRYDVVGDNWTGNVENGALKFSTGAGDKIAMKGVTMTDGVCQVDLTVTKAGNAGLMFRATNLTPIGDGLDGYYVGVGDKSLELGRMDQNWNSLKWVSVPELTLGSTHTLKVVATGSRIRVYLDNVEKPYIDITDDTYKKGGVGIRGFHAEGTADNLKVYGDGLSNLARTASLETGYSHTDIKSIIDGQLGWGWDTWKDPGDLEYPVNLDLNWSGEIYEIESLNILWHGDNANLTADTNCTFPKSCKLQYFDVSSGSWTDITEMTDESGGDVATVGVKYGRPNQAADVPGDESLWGNNRYWNCVTLKNPVKTSLLRLVIDRNGTNRNGVAIGELEVYGRRSEIQEIDKTALREAIDTAETDGSGYTPSSWAEYETALNSARAVNADANATQADVVKALLDLNNAKAALKRKADKGVLQGLINNPVTDGGKYTEESWNDYATALGAAREMNENENATQEETDAAAETLRNAQAALVLKSAVVEMWDDFGDANYTERYEVVGGSWKGTVENGVLNFSTGGGDKIARKGVTMTDGVCQVDLTIVEGGNAGLIFRATNLREGADALNGYYAGIGRDYIELGRMDQNWNSLKSVPIPELAQNSLHTLKVVAVGSRIRVYLDGGETPYIDVTDDKYKEGSVGIRGFNVRGTADNLKVTMKKADKTGLQAAIDGAVADSEKDNYTPASWSAYVTALSAARTVNENPYAAQAEVNEALAALDSAKAALELIAKRTISLTSRVDGSADETTVALLTGGGTFETPSTQTVAAPEKDGYEFKGWYLADSSEQGYAGDAISKKLSYTFELKENISLVAVYTANAKVRLSITGTNFTVNGGSNQATGSYSQEINAGTKITLAATGENFAYWMNSSKKIVSTSAQYEFTLVGNAEYTPVYKNAQANSAFVEFVSDYGQIMQAAVYGVSERVDLPSGPSKMGYQFTGWSMTAKDIQAAIAEGTTYIKVTPVYAPLSDKYTVTVNYVNTGASQPAEEYKDQTVGSTMTLTARTIAGRKFSHWASDAAGANVLGTSENYYIAITGDVVIYAVYVEEAAKVEKKPVIAMTDIFTLHDGNKDKLAFSATRDIPQGYTLVEQGMLYALVEGLNNDSMIIGGANVFQYKAASVSEKGVFTLYINVTGHTDAMIYTRGYVIVKNNTTGNLETYYSEISSASYNTISK